ITATENSGTSVAIVPFSTRFVSRVSLRLSSATGSGAIAAESVLASPNMWLLAIICTSALPVAWDAATGIVIGDWMASPVAGAGTSNQMILASCHPITMTRNRLTQGGNTLFIVASALPPSILEKSVQFALLIISLTAVLCGFTRY